MNKNSVVIVTGANTGIGASAAQELSGLGAHVVMACRSPERGEKALFELRAKTGGSAELMLCDLASLQSVEDFCERFLERHNRLDVLVNNAGTMSFRRRETKDGYELNFGVNFLGHFLMTNRLLPLLKKSAPSRIVNVTSIAHRFGKIRFKDLNLKKYYNWWRGYAQSKLAIAMGTYVLAQKLEGTGVTVNCIHPGIVGTDIIVNRESGGGSMIARLQRMLFMSCEQGAQPVTWLAASEDAQGITGKYYSKGEQKRSSRRSYDMEAAQRLWNLCGSICGLCEPPDDSDVSREQFEGGVSAPL